MTFRIGKCRGGGPEPAAGAAAPIGRGKLHELRFQVTVPEDYDPVAFDNFRNAAALHFGDGETVEADVRADNRFSWTGSGSGQGRVSVGDSVWYDSVAGESADGAYSFDRLPVLPEGVNYVVAVTAREGYEPAKAGRGGDAGSDSTSGSETARDLVEDGDRDATLDFGFVKVPEAAGPTDPPARRTSPAPIGRRQRLTRPTPSTLFGR